MNLYKSNHPNCHILIKWRLDISVVLVTQMRKPWRCWSLLLPYTPVDCPSVSVSLHTSRCDSKGLLSLDVTMLSLLDLLAIGPWEDVVVPEEASVEDEDVESVATTALTPEESVNLTDTVAATDREYCSTFMSLNVDCWWAAATFQFTISRPKTSSNLGNAAYIVWV